MNTIALIQVIVGSIPKLLQLIRMGRDIRNVKLGEIISEDALRQLEEAKEMSEDFVKNG